MYRCLLFQSISELLLFFLGGGGCWKEMNTFIQRGCIKSDMIMLCNFFLLLLICLFLSISQALHSCLSLLFRSEPCLWSVGGCGWEQEVGQSSQFHCPSVSVFSPLK